MNEERQAKREKWAGVLKNCEESGMSAAAYCRANGIPNWQFAYWKRQLRSKADDKADGCFVAFPFSDERRKKSGLWFELPSGLRLMIESGFDIDELFRVLKVVGGGKC